VHRDHLPYAAPQQLLDLAERDRAGLLGQFEQALEHVRKTRRLGPSDLKLPIQLSPFDTSINPFAKTLGFACVVMPPTEGHGSRNKGTFSLYPVRPPPSLPHRPAALQHFGLVGPALVRA